MVIRIRFLGRRPVRIGDWIVNNRSRLAVIRIDYHVTVYRNDGCDGFPEVLGFLAACIVPYLHKLGIHTDVSVPAVIHKVNVYLIPFQLAIAVFAFNLCQYFLGNGRLGNIDGSLDNAREFIRFGRCLPL